MGVGREDQPVAARGDLLDARGGFPQAAVQPVGGRAQHAAVGIQRLAGQGLAQALQALVVLGVAAFQALAEGGEAVRVEAGTQAQLQAALAEQVEYRGVLGQAQGVFLVEHDDAGAQLDVPGALGGRAEQHQRRGQAAVLAGEMVLGQPAAVEAQCLGGLEQLQGLLVQARLELRGIHAVEKAQAEGAVPGGMAHGWRSWSICPSSGVSAAPRPSLAAGAPGRALNGLRVR